METNLALILEKIGIPKNTPFMYLCLKEYDIQPEKGDSFIISFLLERWLIAPVNSGLYPHKLHIARFISNYFNHGYKPYNYEPPTGLGNNFEDCPEPLVEFRVYTIDKEYPKLLNGETNYNSDLVPELDYLDAIAIQVDENQEKHYSVNVLVLWCLELANEAIENDWKKRLWEDEKEAFYPLFLEKYATCRLPINWDLRGAKVHFVNAHRQIVQWYLDRYKESQVKQLPEIPPDSVVTLTVKTNE